MSAVEKTLKWICIAGIFVLPIVAVIVANNLFFPYITGKNFTFRVVVEIITGSWLALALVDAKYRPARGWIFGAFALFVLIIAIADAQGAMPFKSFWSNYERMDGWVTLAHLLCYFVVAISVLRVEHLWRRLFQWSIGISGFLSVLGLLQVAGFLDFGSGGTGLSARVDATFGNPIYLAVYMLFHIFLAVLLWAQEGSERWSFSDKWVLPLGSLGAFVLIIWQLANSSVSVKYIPGAFAFYILFIVAVEALMLTRRRWALLFFIGLDTLALLFSGTRGATLGLIGGTLLALLIYAFLEGSKRVRTYAITSIVIVAVVAGGLKLARSTPLVQNVGFLDRLASISLTDPTVRARLINIGMAWQGIKERPILGWGQENFALVFDKYYDPSAWAEEQWFDRVHNIIFDWWIAGGTVGLLSYLALLGAALWGVWRRSAFNSLERSILTGLLAGYVIHNLTVFDNITSYILFGTVLGYIAYRESQAGQSKPLVSREFLPQKSLPVVAALATVLVLWSAWSVNANALAANRTLLSALTDVAQAGQISNMTSLSESERGTLIDESLSKGLSDFNAAAAYGTYGTQEVREQLSQAADEVASAPATLVPDNLKQQYLQDAVSQLHEQSLLSPLDARFPVFAGTTYDAFGDYTDGWQSLMQANKLSPGKQSILYLLAQNAAARGDTQTELNIFAQAFNEYPDDSDARIYYAAALINAKQDAQAEQVLAPIIPSGLAADPRIDAAYASRGLYSKIVPLWQAHVKAKPDDIQGYFTLAAAYYAAGEKSQAVSVLQQVEQMAPSAASQAQSAIQQIQSGQ